VDFDYMANVARLNAATLASLAAAPGAPQNVKLETKELTNNSTLHWDAPPDGRATGYMVLWRATSAPAWEHSQEVEKATRITLPVSKDNAIFAVQSVDAGGHRSEPIVPSPER
jgi:hypothetical protein